MAAEQLTDKENQFRKRARRRLVGAVALVLLMVTVLPMVLDDRGGQKPPQPEIAISIPSQDGTDFSSKIVPVAPGPAAPTKPEVRMASPLEQPHEAAAPVKHTEPGEVVAAEAKPVAATKPAEPAPAEEPPAAAPAKSVPAAARTPDEAKPPQSAAAEIRKGTVSVQIGVFSDAAKVKQLRAKIAEAGIQCYTENLKTPKGTKIRLRCGPFPGKTEAQQALEQIKTAGFGGILVTNQ